MFWLLPIWLLQQRGEVLMTVRSGIFFFQAEVGIRDVAVTGVQTCALPISRHGHETPLSRLQRHSLKGIPRGVARSADAVLHVFPAAYRNDRLRIRAGQRREAQDRKSVV